MKKLSSSKTLPPHTLYNSRTIRKPKTVSLQRPGQVVVSACPHPGTQTPYTNRCGICVLHCSVNNDGGGDDIFSVDPVSKCFFHMCLQYTRTHICMYIDVCVCAVYVCAHAHMHMHMCTHKLQETKCDSGSHLLQLLSAIFTDAVSQMNAELACMASLANQLSPGIRSLLPLWWNQKWAALPAQRLHSFWRLKALVLKLSQQALYPQGHLPSLFPTNFAHCCCKQNKFYLLYSPQANF